LTVWAIQMRWQDLLFAHWPVDPSALAGLLPDGLELDLWDGRAWIGVVPFTMAGVGPRGLPSIPGFGTFAEINVRTYVRHQGASGVFFLSLDGANRVTVFGARHVFHLPYFRAQVSSIRAGTDVVYRSRRVDRRGSEARFAARFSGIGASGPATVGSLDAWLTDRLRLFAVDRSGRIWRTEVRHRPWNLQSADADIEVNSMATAAGIELPDEAPRLRYAARLDVQIGLPESGP